MEENTNFIIYHNPNGEVKVDVFVEGETVWLTQKTLGELFGVSKSTISEHLSNIFTDRELDEDSVVRNFRTTASDGKKYNTNYYNLDAIISVGYRVNSSKATQFRIWATQTLKEYIIKGFAMNDERLKQGKTVFGKDYFRELLERVRSIRSSERRIYQQITDIFAECSIDYNPQSEITREFFATVQNLFHFAITGQTAAEIIHEKADREKDHMGLSTWKNAPNGRVLAADVVIAKNYLQENEIKKLERTITGFFDYIENIIENRQSFTMTEFAASVVKFLSFNEYRILEGKGEISKKQADEKALTEYREYNKTQKIESDFDRSVKKILGSQSDD
jgi:hypothetical protein